MGTFNVSLKTLTDRVSMEVVYTPRELDEISVEIAEVNRPGLFLAGYYDYFDKLRLQIMGLAEMNFLSGLTAEKRYEALEQLFRQQPPAVIVCRSEELAPFPEMQELAQKHAVALLRSNETTCTLMGSLISVLNLELAPRITRHGVLVEVYGEGILILGDSGIGKSELAIELVKRGHRLVADDAVELRKVSNRQIMGTAPENIRHFIELRGIGIVNVARVYGVGAVKLSESLDLVVQLEAWDPTKNYQRTGLESEYYDILGVSIPSTSIPVSPGRNLAVVLETAAINNRQKKMGYNAAKQLLTAAGIAYKENEPLAAHCTFKIGGAARLLVQPTDRAQLCRAVALCKAQGVRYYLLGNGSNILFADEGYNGAVLDVSSMQDAVEVHGTQLTAGAGVRLSALCKTALEHGLTGLEFAYGIPGTVGGAVYMNAGAYGGEMKDVLTTVQYLTAEGEVKEAAAAELDLRYRHSIFEENGGCILSAQFALTPGEPEAIRAKMDELMAKRLDKQPLDKPSAGSTFKRPVGAFAAALIDQCGLRGYRHGGAAVSEKHCGFVVNLGGATCADVLALCEEVRTIVKEKTGYDLEKEIRVVR